MKYFDTYEYRSKFARVGANIYHESYAYDAIEKAVMDAWNQLTSQYHGKEDNLRDNLRYDALCCLRMQAHMVKQGIAV